MPTVKQATAGAGFDVNQPLSGAQAAAFKAAGMDFCIRYLPRTPALISGNLTAKEIEIILTAGLSLMAVQHVAMPGWEPNAALGLEYGSYAAQYAKEISLAPGINLWLDLEGVGRRVKAEDVIAYCQAWYTAVSASGYVPGLYVGWNVVLSDQQLYDLPFAHYWKAYNCDQSIPTEGWQILQHPQLRMSGIEYDPDTIQADELGDLPVWVSA
jgi:hypothetical protein